MDWIMDGSTEMHGCGDEKQLNKCVKYENGGEKRIKGYIPWLSQDGVVTQVPIENVKINPELKHNIISINTLLRKGFRVQYNKDKCAIYRNDELVLEEMISLEGYKVKVFREECLTTQTDNALLKKTENLECITEEPQDLKGVLRLSQEEQTLWREAMTEEINCLRENQVLENHDPQPSDRVIGSRWTYCVKYDEDGNVSRIRARLVAMGCHQREGTDFGETYAPVVTQTTIRVLLTMAANQRMQVRHCDIASAFLYGELEETIFMREPHGQEEPRKVYRLHKAIYRLKQAAHCWYDKINASLIRLGYSRCSADQCLYKKLETDNSHSFIIIHVDDLLLISKKSEEINNCIDQLNKEFKVKDLGEAHKYLGIYLERDSHHGIIYAHQKPMIRALLLEHGLDQSRPVHTPMAHDYLKSQAHIESTLLTNNLRYQQAIGSLLYLGLMTRPDIHLSVNILSRKTATPNQWDWEGVKRVLKYLCMTIDSKLTLGGLESLKLSSFCDADWGGDNTTRRSTSGKIHLLGSSLIEWKARRQNCISLSTAEAEFIAAAEALQTLCWIRTLLKELSIPEDLPFILHTDNQSCMKICESPKPTKRTKYVDIKYHFVKEMIKNKIIEMKYCPTDNMVADIMTKPLGRSQHWRLAKMLGMQLK